MKNREVCGKEGAENHGRSSVGCRKESRDRRSRRCGEPGGWREETSEGEDQLGVERERGGESE